MESRLGKYGYLGITLILSILFLAGAFLFARNFASYMVMDKKIKVAKNKVLAFKQLRREQNRAKRILSRIAQFTEKASSMGLKKEDWRRYDVDISEKVTFTQLKEILEQTVSKSNYYFSASFISISRVPPRVQTSGAKPTEAPQGGPGTPGGTEEGDVYLSLKGFFLVRQEAW